MTATPRLTLPLLAAGQAQKHVTHNDALTRLDALIHLMVISRSQATPPASPTDLSAYLVPAGATGVFSGRTDQLALYEDAGWTFLVPRKGWQCWIEDEAELHVWTGTEWRRASPLSSLGAAVWGVNGTADTTTRFVVSAAASLFNHAGAGHQVKLNKAATGDTASLLYQTGYSGRAEIGLAGDDNLRVKVSPDGASWTEALVIDGATGEVSLPASLWAQERMLQNLLVNGDLQINQRGFAGGALAAGVYGFDRWKAHSGGATLTLSGHDISLSAGAIVQPVEPALWGVASFAATPLCLSVENLTGGSLTVTLGSVSGTITAGTGRRSVTLTPASGDTGTLAVRLTPASGAVGFRRIKLEFGAAATGWAARPLALEQLLCRRYLWKHEGSVLIDAYQVAAGTFRQQIALPARMRATPSVSFSVSQEINIQGGTDRGITVQSPDRAYAHMAADATGRVRAAFDDIVFEAEL
jgi:hypothetical protein